MAEGEAPEAQIESGTMRPGISSLIGIFQGLAAAALFGVSTPLAKTLFWILPGRQLV